MYTPAVTVRRIDVLIRILSGRNAILVANPVRAYSSEDKVTIGDVSKHIKNPKKVEYVPRKYCKCIQIYNLCPLEKLHQDKILKVKSSNFYFIQINTI